MVLDDVTLFDERLEAIGELPLRATEVTTLQVNLGKLCNQACRHCHVDAGPHRTEPDVNMGSEVAEQVVRVLRQGGFHTIDLTGGAPELNPHFRHLVRTARELDVSVIDRCNLSVLFEPGQEDLGSFLAENRAREGVVVLDSGLQYVVHEEGSGETWFGSAMPR